MTKGFVDNYFPQTLQTFMQWIVANQHRILFSWLRLPHRLPEM